MVKGRSVFHVQNNEKLFYMSFMATAIFFLNDTETMQNLHNGDKQLQAKMKRLVYYIYEKLRVADGELSHYVKKERKRVVDSHRSNPIAAIPLGRRCPDVLFHVVIV